MIVDSSYPSSNEVLKKNEQRILVFIRSLEGLLLFLKGKLRILSRIM